LRGLHPPEPRLFCPMFSIAFAYVAIIQLRVGLSLKFCGNPPIDILHSKTSPIRSEAIPAVFLHCAVSTLRNRAFFRFRPYLRLFPLPVSFLMGTYSNSISRPFLRWLVFGLRSSLIWNWYYSSRKNDQFAPAVFSGIDVHVYTRYNVENVSSNGVGLPHRKKRVH